MGFRATFIFILLFLSATPSFAIAMHSVDEPLSEANAIVVAIDHDDVASVTKWLNSGHSPSTKINNKLHEGLLERSATHAAPHCFEVLFLAAHAAHGDSRLKDARGTPLLVTLSELAVPGKPTTEIYERMIELMLSTSPELAQAQDHAYIGDGRSALHQAAAVGNLHVAEILLLHGAQANAKNSSGEVPLHLAARFGHLEVAKLLIAHGAIINVKSKFTQTTPLMAAAEMGHENVIRMLMMAGAERDLRDTFGKTAPERFREYRLAYVSSTPRKIQN